MTHSIRAATTSAAVLALALPAATAAQDQTPVEPLVIAPGFEQADLPVALLVGGAMAKLAGGRILIVGSTDSPPTLRKTPGNAKLIGLTSTHGGRTWGNPRTLVEDPAYSAHRATLLRTRAGALWMVYYGFVEYDKQSAQKSRSDLYLTSSSDDGATWRPSRRLFEGYTAGYRGFIETGDGNLVITFSHGVDQGRNVSRSLVSADGGKTWRQSAAIELGGSHAHSGALEPNVVELRDGRLWMLIRHQDHFWQAYSKDGGLTWSEPTETAITAPGNVGGSPAALVRLASGRLAMAWNPRTETPADASDFRKHGRGALAVALSDDDGRTWAEPVVAALGGSVAYPSLLEVAPGELLLATGVIRATEQGTGQRISTDVVVLRFAESQLLSRAGR